jgi:hypothetical protein
MFLVTYVTRSHSSRLENRNNKTFETLEQAVAYIQGEWYSSFCELNNYPDNWHEDDFGSPMPKREDFSLEVINEIRSREFWLGILFAPYSTYQALVSDELHLQEIKD